MGASCQQSDTLFIESLCSAEAKMGRVSHWRIGHLRQASSCTRFV